MRENLALITSIVVATPVAFALLVVVRRKWRGFKKQTQNVYDSLVGAEPIVDPETGAVLREARAPMVSRVAHMEDSLVKLTDTFTTAMDSWSYTHAIMAETQKSIVETQSQIGALTGRQQRHEEESDRWAKEHADASDAEHSKIWSAIHAMATPSPTQGAGTGVMTAVITPLGNQN